MKKFSVSTMWDSRAIRPDNKSRVMLCVVLPNRSSFKLSLKIQCTKADYDKVMSGRSLNVYQQGLRKEISSFVLKGEELIERLAEPTKDNFSRFFKSDFNLSSSKIEVYLLFQLKINVVTMEGRFGSAMCIRTSMRSLQSFKKVLYLEDIDEGFLKGYQSYMMKKGNSITTCNMYLRELKSIYNQAIKDGLISGHLKPFANIKMASSIKSKSVLYPEQLKQLWDYHCGDSIRDRRAIAMFFFCYLNNGMNFRDVMFLKWKNINGDFLSFVRQKTKRTKQSQSEIIIYLTDVSKKIIDEWGSSYKHPENYIFQFVPKYTSDKHLNDTIGRYKRYANKSLSRIGKKLGFNVHLCLNLARHSFATSSKLANVPVSIISELMGHASTLTTNHYLKSIPTNMLKEVNNHLLDFTMDKSQTIPMIGNK